MRLRTPNSSVAHVEEHAEAPRFHCKIVHKEQHAPFEGFNRAANAVLECAILLTRLQLLPRDKIEREIAYLAIAIERQPARGSASLVLAHAKARSILCSQLSTSEECDSRGRRAIAGLAARFRDCINHTVEIDEGTAHSSRQLGG